MIVKHSKVDENRELFFVFTILCKRVNLMFSITDFLRDCENFRG